MKQITLIIVFLVSQQLLAQEKTDYYQIGGKYASEGNYEKAIENFNKELEREPKNYYAMYNKALCESRLGKHKKSIIDFSKAIELKTDYYKAYLNRAIVKRNITDYKGALSDLNKSLEIKENYPEAYYHRGIINEYLKNYDQACKDLTRAKELGINKVEEKIEITCESQRESNYSNILNLPKNSTDKTYGFSGDNPIKVGTGLKGGPANQRAFLNLLRDSHGNIITYERMGSCCDYESKNGFFGTAKSDIYEITYLDKTGNVKKVNLHISFYDYEEPMIPIGFQTIKI